MPASPVDYNITPPSLGQGGSDDNDDTNGSNIFFWPILILIVGAIVSTGYQIVVMQDQLKSMTDTVGQMDGKVKQAEYQKAKLYKLASDILELSATDPNARQIVIDYKIQAGAPAQTSDSSAK